VEFATNCGTRIDDMLTKLLAGILGAILLGVSLSVAAAEQEPGGADEWWFGAEAYLWAPWIDVETETGSDVEITLNDILSNLDFLFMSSLTVGKGRWSLVTDLIYFDIETNENESLPLSLTLDDVDLQAWVVTPQVRYTVTDSNKYKFGLVAGARYLWLEAQLQLKTRPPLPPGSRKAEDSGSVWDGIVGVTGHMELSEKWYLQGYADIGTGDSDYTWQALGGFGYRFKRVDAAVGYRYLTYEFDSDAPLADLTVHGPIVGVRFGF
jgi:hypothetical protein